MNRSRIFGYGLLALMLAPVVMSAQAGTTPDCSAVCTDWPISPSSVDCRSAFAEVSSAAVMVMPLDAANWEASRSPTRLPSTNPAKPVEKVPGPPSPSASVGVSWLFSSCSRQPPAEVVSNAWSWVLRLAVEMVAPLAVAAGGVTSQAEANPPEAITMRAATAP